MYMYIREISPLQISCDIFKNTFYYLKGESNNRNEFSPFTNFSRYYFSILNPIAVNSTISFSRGGNSVSTIGIIWTLRRLSVHLCSINAEEDAISERESVKERPCVFRAQKGSERERPAISDVIDTCMDQETELPVLRPVVGGTRREYQSRLHPRIANPRRSAEIYDRRPSVIMSTVRLYPTRRI